MLEASFGGRSGDDGHDVGLAMAGVGYAQCDDDRGLGICIQRCVNDEFSVNISAVQRGSMMMTCVCAVLEIYADYAEDQLCRSGRKCA
jgi:hypothetical protein